LFFLYTRRMRGKKEFSPFELRLKVHYLIKKVFKSHFLFNTLFRSIVPKRNVFKPPAHQPQNTIPVLLNSTQWQNNYFGICFDTDSFPWYTTFIHFCENNRLPYKIFNIHQSDWLEQSRPCDVIFWRPANAQHSIKEAMMKVKILNEMGIKTFPPLYDLMLYENKSLQFSLLRETGLPVVPTFISHDYDESRLFLKDRKMWPLVSKVKTGSASIGVRLLKNEKEASHFLKKAFTRGIRYFWHGDRQKYYVLFQDYVDNMGYDLRIITAGDTFFGYYRYPKKNDFRASGSGFWSFTELPQDALKLAQKVKTTLGLSDCSVDFIRDKNGTLHIIEVSLFTLISSPAQAIVNEQPGYYIRQETGDFIFSEGYLWPQHLMLKHFLQEYVV